MSDIGTHRADWRCHLGRHHFVRQTDDNPEVRGQSVLVCTRCGQHDDGPAVSGSAAFFRAAGMG